MLPFLPRMRPTRPRLIDTLERTQNNCREMKWLIAQRTGTVSVDTLDRDDVTVVDAPAECIGFITGFKGQTLREIEASSGTFIFTDAGSKDSETGQESYFLQASQIARRALRQPQAYFPQHSSIVLTNCQESGWN